MCDAHSQEHGQLPETTKPRMRIRTSVDSGYAWVILTCSFVIMFLTNLMWASYGVYIIEFRDYYPSYNGLFAWMYAANIMVVGLTGIVAGPLVRVTGVRAVTVCGAVMISSGYLIGSNSTHVVGVFVAYAVLLGMGYSFVNMATNVATQQYFNKKRGFANGILLTGSTLSIFVAPPAVTFLIQSYGWRGAFLIQGGVCLNAVPAGFLLLPFLGTHREAQKIAATQPSTKCQRCTQFSKSLCACYLLRNIPFLLIMLGSLLYFFAQHTPIVFTVARSVQFGISRQKSALVMSVWAVTCMCGQVVLGWVGDRIKRGPVLALSLIGAGVVLLLSIACSTFPLQLAYGAIYGLMLAAYNSMKIPTLVDILGVEHLAAAHGINLLVGGVGGLVGPPISNMIAERSGSYAISFGMAGMLIIVSGLLMLMAVTYEPCMKRLCHHKETPVFAETEYTAVPMKTHTTLQEASPYIAASINSINMC